MGVLIVEKERKMAYSVRIDGIMKHPNADALELAIVGGWQCVVKLGEFKVGDIAIYCEIDCLLPLSNPYFAFLAARTSDTKVFDEVEYHRLKSIKMRKELSQGLLLKLPDGHPWIKTVGTNLTEELGIFKYAQHDPEIVSAEPKEDLTLWGKFLFWIMGDLQIPNLPWPQWLTKTTEDRLQNSYAQFTYSRDHAEEFEVSYKLDGASMTVFCNAPHPTTGELRFGVCSRNGELQLEPRPLSFWESTRLWFGTFLARNRRFYRRFRIAIPAWITDISDRSDFVVYVNQHDVLSKLKQDATLHNKSIVVQGELVGPGIQGNFENLESHQYYIYKVFVDSNYALPPSEARKVVYDLGLDYIPVLEANYVISPIATIKDVLQLADGPAAFNTTKGSYREGVVMKSNHRDVSWKIISNSYLLKQND